jgi:2-dehydropantoate 2-reductase
MKADQAGSFLIYGAGAIGTYIGGSLALHGHRVVFLERPEVAEELRQRGMCLKIDEQEHQIDDPKMAGSLEEAIEQGPFETAIFALKSFDTQPALEKMAPYQDQMPPILCLQNGIENEAALSAVLGKKKVIAGTVTSAIGRRAAGDIVLERHRGMGVAADNPVSSYLVEVFNAAGLNARLYRHAADMKWSKMVTNLLANATSAILDLTPAQIFENPKLHRLEVNQLREALKVMSALHLSTVDLPGTPVRALTFAVRSLPVALSRTLMKNAVGSGRGEKMPSFYIDLHSGRGKSEIDYLNGAIVRQGEKLGIPTPVNRLLNNTLLALTQGELPLDTYAHQPEKLLKMLDQPA